MPRGTIKFIRGGRGYLFVTPDRDSVHQQTGNLTPEKDVYVSAVRFPEWITAKAGDRVEFDVEPSRYKPNGLEDVNVRLIPSWMAD